MPAAFPIMREVLDGTTASGEYEARMGREEFGKEVHVYAPAYTPGEVESLTRHRRPHLFQFARADRPLLSHRKAQARHRGRHSHQSRLLERDTGRRALRPVRALLALRHHKGELDKLPWEDIDIFHVHALCESCTTARSSLIEHVAREFAPYLRRSRP